MAKSLGNVLSVSALVAKGIRAVELRYYLAAPHYRSPIDFSDEALHEAGAAYRRIEGFAQRASELVGAVELAELPGEFVAAMDDDLNTSRALAVVHDTVRTGNALLADGDRAAVGAALSQVRAMLDVLGLDPQDPQWIESSDAGLTGVVDSLVALALEQRTAARARKDWAAADVVRDQLKQAGVVVEDTPAGPRWTLSVSEGN
jgi:cysteinyl-tRNA synthetase